MGRGQEVGLSQTEDAHWHIETLKSPQHQLEARRRLQYVTLMPKLALCCLILDWLYLGYRIVLVTRAPRVDKSAYVVLSIEIGFAATAGLQHLQSLSAWGRAKLKPAVRLTGERLPTVDVFLPCCGEELGVIMDTVRAACALDYPSESYRIVVLDDGCSNSVRDSIDNLSREQNRKNLYYTSRGVKVVSFSKIGNLNFGLECVESLPSGPSDFVAVLDIDMIPLPYWLRAMLPYLVTDVKIGLANPPQRFYNIPNQDPFAQNFDIVFDGIETIKDVVSSSWCTGTGFVVRRRALDQIQGFPTGNKTGHTGLGVVLTMYLTAAGWKTTYVPETVQWGLVPDTVRKQYTQRVRWIAIFLASIDALWSERTKGQATLKQRAGATVLSVVVITANALLAFSAVAVPWVLFTGSQTVVYQSSRQLQVLLYLESLSFLAALLSGFKRSRSGRSYGPIFLDFEQVGLSPFQATTMVRVTLSRLIGRKLQSFAPSGKSTTSNMPSWFTVLTRKMDVNLVSNLFIFSAHLVGGCVGLRTVVAAAQQESFSRSLFSLAGYPAFFLLWGKYIIQTGTAIPLMISSQAIWPLRESLLVRNPTTKVAYPSEEAVNPRRVGVAQTFAKLALFYHCIVLVFAWRMG